MSILRYVLVKTGLSERRKDGRVPSRGLDVSYWNGLEERRVKVKDISTTGIFLLTEERWLPGTVVRLTFQKRGLLDRDTRPQVRLRARCVRLSDDGAGLTFIDDPAMAESWTRSMLLAAELLPGSHTVRLFRTARAISFLLQISPSAEAGILQLITSLCSDRVERAIEIVLQAEELLASDEYASQLTVSPSLVLGILENGSKAEEGQVQSCWAGLLASSCFEETQDSPLRFAVLLSRLDRDHVAILTAACSRAMRTGWGPGFVFSSNIYCSVDEIRKIAGVRNLLAIEGNLNHLHLLGLLEKTIKPLGCAQLDQVNITPTGLGLKLYFRCGGRVELPEALDRSALQMAS